MQLWDTETWKSQDWNAHNDTINCIARNGCEIVTGSSDGQCKVWDIRQREPVAFTGPSKGSPFNVVETSETWASVWTVSSVGHLVAVGWEDGSIQEWDLRNQKILFKQRLQYGVTSMAHQGNGDALAVGDTNNRIYLYDAARKSELWNVRPIFEC